jgi:hypothetical protein
MQRLYTLYTKILQKATLRLSATNFKLEIGEFYCNKFNTAVNRNVMT